MKKSRLSLAVLLTLLTSFAAPVPALGITFTNDTLIQADNTNFDGQDIVVTNCVLTVNGDHTFASLHLLNRGILTHPFSTNGQIQYLQHVVAEAHVLSDSNPPTLNLPNVLTNTLRVTDSGGALTYTQGIDYAVLIVTNGFAQLIRLAGSIPDGGAILANYDALSVPVATGVNLAILGDVQIEPGGAINVGAVGYGPGFGPGAGVSRSTNSPFFFTAGSGGGNGGYGGASSTLAPGGLAYGSILNPATRGSGGGAGSGPGGAGGGQAKLIIGGLLRVDGAISANGGNGTNSHSGGGAGGSLWLTSQTLSGSGAISANGGGGEPADGGGGGGGHIAMFYATNQFAGTLWARGGQGAVYGGAGTVFTSSQGDSSGQILIDNGGSRGTNTLLSLSGGYDLTISGGAVVHPATTAMTLANLLIRSNSWLTHLETQTSLWLTVNQTATVEAGGGIDVTAKGLAGGVGFGGTIVYQSGYTSAGGGHGGIGGAGITNVPGGNAYGSILLPFETGSGGGDRIGHGLASHGGGAVRLAVGALQVDGAIKADGAGAIGEGSAGGAGGGIYLSVNSLTGTGLLSANGGAGNLPFGGGGGGGRIAIYYNTNRFTGSIAAIGGLGVNSGGAGTIYTKSSRAVVGQLVVDNAGTQGARTPLSLAIVLTDLQISGSAIGVIPDLQVAGLGILQIAPNSWLTFSNHVASATIVTASNAVIQANGGILLDGLGYPGGQGPGAGRSLSSINFGLTGGGGGYGGNGGPSALFAAGGSANGDVISPQQNGSGGGAGNGLSTNNLGGAGGGALRLNISGALVVDGLISANGAAGIGQGSGGGSGGGLYLSVGTISGAGSISAKGGVADLPNGGGGGGGRIGIFFKTNQFTGTITAAGGPGAIYGGAGTVYLSNTSQGGGSFGSKVLIDNAGTIGAGTPLAAFESPDLIISGGAQVQLTSSPNFRNLLIATNSSLSYTSSFAPKTVNILSNATIQAGGSFTLDGQGFAPGSGTGAGFGGHGGGYGGYGGGGPTNGVAGGNSYGSLINPVDMGSGGGATIGGPGGAGGGAVHLMVNGALTVDGSVTANGNPGKGGGGAGGSLWINAKRLGGAGLITANGGQGDPQTSGGGGGGGRIAIYYDTNLFTGAIAARGGTSPFVGGAGTVYLKTANNERSQIIIDNGGSVGTNTPLAGLQGLFDLAVRGAARANLFVPLSLGDLLVASNSWLICTSTVRTLSVAGTASIEASGALLLDGQGFLAGSGPGAGVSLGLSGGGGAGYGGYGGSSSSNAPGGNSYGSVLQPVDLGSGGGTPLAGGVNPGGAGGGALHINSYGTFLLNGRLSADGLPPTSQATGGGSGGSLWLTVGSLSGAGSISANGGSGNLPNGGGGGGGRIATYYSTNQFTGTFSARGGAGANYGGAGTIYIKSNRDSVAQLIVDNGGSRGTNTPLAVVGSVDLTVTNGAQMILSTDPLLQNLTIASNASLSYVSSPQSRDLTVRSNASILAGGAIMMDGRGSPGGQGPGAGATLSTPPAFITGGGGGNGGYGGASALGAAGGTAYGFTSLSQNQAGSGGGSGTGVTTNNLGGAGGGTLGILVGARLTVNGRISADGLGGVGQGSGGGSGGNLWLQTRDLSGSGSISANGGAGDLPLGGGGGGGHIAVYYNSNRFTGVLSAGGGVGASAGGAGTIFTKASNDPVSQVLADNRGASGTNTLLSSLSTYDLTIRNGAKVVPATGLMRNLVINSNSWLTLVRPLSGTNLQLSISNNARLEAGGGITAEGYGAPGGQGAGPGGTFFSPTDGFSGGGGGHGGFGGVGAEGAAGGNVYGSVTQPTELGSGGGGYAAEQFGAAGGGAIRIDVQGSLFLAGKISADGKGASYEGSGGGSGGSVWLSASYLSGNGSISANGGAGDFPLGGGGGGGRVALYGNFTNFNGTVSARGGSGSLAGGAGTIYSVAQGASIAQVIVNNGGLAGTNTPLAQLRSNTPAVSPPQPFDLILSGGAKVHPTDPALLLHNLSVDTGATLTELSGQTNLDLTVLGDATVRLDGAIVVDGKGYSGSNGGPGAGQMPSGNSGSGAGYGGPGGASASGVPGGMTYGFAAHPIDRGSRGGTDLLEPQFCQGGGAIRLRVGGALTLNGRVSANGNDALPDRSGGGSGGSVWISARQISGSGFIAANGGAGESAEGGGGGGGRIAVYSRASSFNGPVVAYGGQGANFGGNGTVVIDNLTAPQVIAQSPIGVVSYAVSNIDLTFDTPLNALTLSTADIVIETPNGMLPQASLVLSEPDLNTVRISFPPQTSPGYYEIQAGPLIEDIYGLPMMTSYVGSFIILPPVISGRVLDTNGLGVPFVSLHLTGDPVPAITDNRGFYSLEVLPGWSGTITPSRGASLFIPASRSYSNVSADITNQNFVIVPSALLRVTASRQGSNLRLSWFGISGLTYQPFYSSDLSDWFPYGSAIPGADAPIQLTVPIDASPAKFFRFSTSYTPSIAPAALSKVEDQE